MFSTHNAKFTVIATLVALVYANGASATTAVEDLMKYEGSELVKEEVHGKLDALREGGLTAGTQLGFSERAEAIKAKIELHSHELDVIYPFATLLDATGYLPPVIEEVGKSVEVSNGSRLTESAVTFRISTPARFTLQPPTYRDYLFDGFPSPFAGTKDFLPAALKPKTDKERDIWAKSVKEGYSLGTTQADKLIALNLSKANHDFVGMWRYKRLLALGMIKAPAVAKSIEETAVSNNELIIVPRTSEIVEEGKFNPKVMDWKREMSRD